MDRNQELNRLKEEWAKNNAAFWVLERMANKDREKLDRVQTREEELVRAFAALGERPQYPAGHPQEYVR